MINNYFLKHLVAGALGAFSINSLQAGMPVWTFSAPNPATVSVGPGETATVQYTVTNQSQKPKTLLLKPTPGLSASPCVLATRGSTCTLTLTANGSQIPAEGIHTGPRMCENGNLNQCYQPQAKYQIQVNTKKSIAPANTTAVGYYDNGGTLAPLTYTSNDNGATWIVSPTFPAPIPATTDNLLNGVSCNSSGMCAAAGNYVNAGVTTPLSYISSDYGVSWALSPTLPPAQGSAANILNAISCDSAGHCVSGGSFSNVSPTPFDANPLIYNSIDFGSSWNASVIAGASPGSLKCTYCTISGHCVAGGDAYAFGRIPFTYISNDYGVNWTPSTNQPVRIQNETFVSSVSCNDSGNCLAAGNAIDASLIVSPVAYTSVDYGDTWIVSVTQPPVQGIDSNTLNSIACDAVGRCAGVGAYMSVGNIMTPLAYVSTDFGVNWALATTLPPAMGVGDNNLNSISCLSSGLCTAVGTYSIGSVFFPLTYTSNDYGVNWSLSTTLPPAQGSGDNSLNGVS